MKFNLFNPRTWPHPEYGNYLGYNRRCDSKLKLISGQGCPMPVDDIDKVGVWHDNATSDHREIAPDIEFAWRMLKINPFTAKYDKPVYGRFYQYGSAVVMGTLGLFTTPLRFVKYKLFR